MKYGREEDEWDLLTDEGVHYLKDRARLRRDTSYTEMNVVLATRAGVRQFDFHEQSERAAMGHLLGRIVEATYPSLGFMLSSIVIYLDANDAGPGFYALAQHKGLLRSGASREEKEAFWVAQVSAAFDYFA